MNMYTHPVTGMNICDSCARKVDLNIDWTLDDVSQITVERFSADKHDFLDSRVCGICLQRFSVTEDMKQ